jgi:hypothetical protein
MFGSPLFYSLSLRERAGVRGIRKGFFLHEG